MRCCLALIRGRDPSSPTSTLIPPPPLHSDVAMSRCGGPDVGRSGAEPRSHRLAGPAKVRGDRTSRLTRKLAHAATSTALRHRHELFPELAGSLMPHPTPRFDQMYEP
ncbi:hypothetical protein Areg01_46760 [Actinoplanes regularis]|nr:hypothetical protein Areg01_46760 [Actinoplanes regularis]